MEAQRRLLVEINDIPEYRSWLRFNSIDISSADDESYERFLEERDQMFIRIESQWQDRINIRNAELREMVNLTIKRKRIALTLIAVLAGSGIALEAVDFLIKKNMTDFVAHKG